MNQHPPSTAEGYLVSVARSDRWQIYHRLQDLQIPCTCTPDGLLRVSVNTCMSAVLVRSTVQQLICSRGELVDWLERCWRTKFEV